MTRIKTDANPALAIMAGPLYDALHMHAGQRLYFFFLYIFTYKALTDRLRAAGLTLKDSEGVSPKATHQIAFGMRRDNPGYYDFLTDDPQVINQPSTSCGKEDAAHFCNLGIKAGFMTKVATYLGENEDQIAKSLLNALVIYAGKTRQLPQRINIGPDRIIDNLHARLAVQMLDGTPPISERNFSIYLEEARRAITDYRTFILGKNYNGLAACCDCYLECYNDAKNVASPWTASEQKRICTSTVSAEANAFRMPEKDYIDRTVI